MLMDRIPIAVIMQRRTVNHRWADTAWSAVAVVADPGGLAPLQPLSRTADEELYLVSGLQLELHRDENDGYYENWAAPEPKIFIMWRMIDERAIPSVASASYAEGTRMLDSGDATDGIPMPSDIHAWLGEYLRTNYQPRPHRGRQHG